MKILSLNIYIRIVETLGGPHGVMIIILEYGRNHPDANPGRDCISHCLDILPPSWTKQRGRMGSLILVWQIFRTKENPDFKPVKRRLKS